MTWAFWALVGLILKGCWEKLKLRNALGARWKRSVRRPSRSPLTGPRGLEWSWKSEKLCFRSCLREVLSRECLKALLTPGVISDPRRPAPLLPLGGRKLIGVSNRYSEVVTDAASAWNFNLWAALPQRFAKVLWWKGAVCLHVLVYILCVVKHHTFYEHLLWLWAVSGPGWLLKWRHTGPSLSLK